MKNDEQVNGTQPIGLDIGTSRIVVARSAEKDSQCEAQLNAFITLPHSKLTEQLLTGENVFHEVHGNDIVVAGNDAEKFAEVFHVETRRPMLDGMLNPHEPRSLAVIRRIITRLVGKPRGASGRRFTSAFPRRIRFMPGISRITSGPAGKSCMSWVTSPRRSTKGWPWFSPNWSHPTTPASGSPAAVECAMCACPSCPCP